MLHRLIEWLRVLLRPELFVVVERHHYDWSEKIALVTYSRPAAEDFAATWNAKKHRALGTPGADNLFIVRAVTDELQSEEDDNIDRPGG